MIALLLSGIALAAGPPAARRAEPRIGEPGSRPAPVVDDEELLRDPEFFLLLDALEPGGALEAQELGVPLDDETASPSERSPHAK